MATIINDIMQKREPNKTWIESQHCQVVRRFDKNRYLVRLRYPSGKITLVELHNLYLKPEEQQRLERMSIR